VPTVRYVIDDGDPRSPQADALMHELRPRYRELGFTLLYSRDGVEVWRRAA